MSTSIPTSKFVFGVPAAAPAAAPQLSSTNPSSKLDTGAKATAVLEGDALKAQVLIADHLEERLKALRPASAAAALPGVRSQELTFSLTRSSHRDRLTLESQGTVATIKRGDTWAVCDPAVKSGKGSFTFKLINEKASDQISCIGVVCAARLGSLKSSLEDGAAPTGSAYLRSYSGKLADSTSSDNNSSFKVSSGDVVRIDVDLEAKTARFFVNGKQHPKVATGIIGPVHGFVYNYASSYELKAKAVKCEGGDVPALKVSAPDLSRSGCEALFAQALGDDMTDSLKAKKQLRAVVMQMSQLEAAVARGLRIQAATAEQKATQSSPKAAGLQRAMGWAPTSSKSAQLCRLLVRLDALIGLEPVRQWIQEQLGDAKRRTIQGEPLYLRHILVKGRLGTGKKTAAELIAMVWSLLHQKEEDIKAPKSAGEPEKSADVAAALEELGVVALRELKDLIDAKTGDFNEKLTPSTVYFMKAQGTAVKNDVDGRVLAEMLRPTVRSVCIIVGDHASVGKYEDLDAMKAVWPSKIDLPLMSQDVLACLVAEIIRRRSYHLCTDMDNPLSSFDMSKGERIKQLRYVIQQTFKESDIQERNVHCANDMIELAISRKNNRIYQALQGQGLRAMWATVVSACAIATSARLPISAPVCIAWPLPLPPDACA